MVEHIFKEETIMILLMVYFLKPFWFTLTFLGVLVFHLSRRTERKVEGTTIIYFERWMKTDINVLLFGE